MTRKLRMLRLGTASIAIALMLSACRQPRLPGGGVPRPPITADASRCAPGQYLEKAFPDVKVKRNVVYGRVADDFGSHVLKMDLYEGKRNAAPTRPVIVWLFGGNFITGDRRQLSEYATEFASRGYVAAAIDYRLLHKHGVSTAEAAEAAQSDAQAAIRFLRARAAELSLDPERIAIAGFSAGSITAFNVAYRGEFIGDNIANLGFPHSVDGVVGLDGYATFEEMQSNDPPFVLFRAEITRATPDADRDEVPGLTQSAEAAGIPYEIQVVKRARHLDLIKRPFSRWIVARAASFLQRNVACR